MRWLAELDRRGVPATLLLVPGPWQGPMLSTDGPLADLLLEAESRGHELALHGYYHRTTHGAGALWRRGVARVVAHGAAEFAMLSQDEARARIEAGLDELASIGVQPVGFHPPGWLINPDCVRALRCSGLRYYSTHLGLHTLAHNGCKARAAQHPARPAAATLQAAAGELRLPAPALSHRPGAVGEQCVARLMAQAAPRLAGEGRAVRIALHPDDLSRPGLRETALRAIDDAIRAGARAMTYAGALGLPRTARRMEHAVAERAVERSALDCAADLVVMRAPVPRAAVEGTAVERAAIECAVVEPTAVPARPLHAQPPQAHPSHAQPIA
jgi:peptidoglycan/xylan/chitin deacetylase (PgdA/CDA1 family)